MRGEYQSSVTCSTAAYSAARYYYSHVNKSGRSANNSSAVQHQRTSSRSFCCFTSNPKQAQGGAIAGCRDHNHHRLLR
jgi:hypothetical protein